MGRRTGAGGGGEAPPIDHEWIDDDAGLAEVVDDLRTAERYAVDTEFHRERSYWPQVALIQLAWGDRVALIDPLAVDPAPLATVFAGDGLAVMHSASQDIEVFDRAVGEVPSRLFDTQIAGGFLGYGTPSLSTLVASEIGVRLPKGDRLTDWMRRPLDDRQRSYAASDVAYLFTLHDRMAARLEEQGRTAWVADECETLRRWRPQRSPEQAYLRIKEARQLRGPTLGAVRAVAAWREERAAELDVPVRHVLGDLGVVTVSTRAPRTVADMQDLRGVDGRLRRGPMAEELLAVVAAGREAGAPAPQSNGASHDLERRYRPAVSLVAAWVAQLARTHGIDASLLATRSDIEELLVSGSGRLASGWRAELVGGPVRDLVEGRAALAFEGEGLVLEPRSGP